MTDTEKAMASAPGYFYFWYTTKSFLLVGTAAALAYWIGKSAGEKACRRR